MKRSLRCSHCRQYFVVDDLKSEWRCTHCQRVTKNTLPMSQRGLSNPQTNVGLDADMMPMVGLAIDMSPDTSVADSPCNSDYGGSDFGGGGGGDFGGGGASGDF